MESEQKRSFHELHETKNETDLQNVRFANSKRSKSETNVSRALTSDGTDLQNVRFANSNSYECETFVSRTPDCRRLVHVDRSPEIQASRENLPILGYEHEVLEHLSDHDVIFICGPTGCGKTTQIPQFLYESGFITGVTQPRRLAAVSIAHRVAEELNSPLGDLVGYQIRHETRTGTNCKIKFMTDGVLIRELQNDFVLQKYTAVVLDEAHERTLNTDVLIGMLSRVVTLRRRLKLTPLKLLIMSATLEAGTFCENPRLFPEAPPVIEIPSRQFPVTIHFSKRTELADYETLALKKVCKIHRTLPPGGILVFLTGRRQIERFCWQLQRELEPKTPLHERTGRCRTVRILPLFAMLPPERQGLVFESVDDDTRLIVVATNVAETSITIPGIRYVVDSGRAKKKRINSVAGVARFDVEWISKASAIQRAGRAGRTAPGHCYRLYSNAYYSTSFPEQDPPEITSIPLESVVLLLKSMGIQKTMSFPFPSMPDGPALRAAEEVLWRLGAIHGDSMKITSLGEQMVEYPISPRHSRMILESIRIESKHELHGLTHFAISLAATMSVETPFLQFGTESKKDLKQIHKKFKTKRSDSLSSLFALLLYKTQSNPVEFCQECYLNFKIMKEMASLQKQLLKIFLNSSLPVTAHLDLESSSRVVINSRPSEEILDCLRRCILAGWCDQVCRREPSSITKSSPYKSCSSDLEFELHPSSVLYKQRPDFVVYVHAMQSSEKNYLHDVTKVDPNWLFAASRVLCEVIHPPVLLPGVFYDFDRDEVCVYHKVLFGKQKWELPLQKLKCEESELASSCFASVVLEGKIFGQDWISQAKLTRTEKYARTTEAKYNKKLGMMILKLGDEGVCNKESLKQKLVENSEFLKPELKLWIKRQHWDEFETNWSKWIDHFIKNR